ALLRPVQGILEHALTLLPDAPDLTVRVGPVAGFYAARGDEVVLSDGLCGPAVSHPDEPAGPVPPMDRWRRAVGSVLEAASLRELSRRTHLPIGDDWRWLGAAIWAADAIAPDLGLCAPDLALAIGTGAPGTHPRAGVAVMRAWAALGIDPIKQVRYVLEGGVVSAPEWARLGQWVLGPDGLAAVPVPVDRVRAVDVPVELPAWSWRPLRVPPHPRGGRVKVEGDGVVDEPWAEADVPLETLAAAAATACKLTPSPGGPIGAWDVASAEGFGQVMGARGIRFGFQADGRLELVLADAFVGPLAAVAMAEQVGTSGVVSGRWRVAGDHRLRFAGLSTQSLTLHSRTRDRFMMPAKGFGLGEWLMALNDDVWSWQEDRAERLVMRGRMMGGEIEVRFKRGQ
ncbi:MAG: hypothetical protein ABMB14_38185, partial [Myxococcota bacterium]